MIFTIIVNVKMGLIVFKLPEKMYRLFKKKDRHLESLIYNIFMGNIAPFKLFILALIYLFIISLKIQIILLNKKVINLNL